jgi:protein phosphatase
MTDRPIDREETKTLTIPELCLVALVGISGSGKSTFGRKHFAPTEVLSSDFFRALISDDENDQSMTAEAFDALYYMASKRLRNRRLTVVDATNVQRDARAKVLGLAKEHDVLAVAIVLDVPKGDCARRNEGRPDRQFGAHVLHRQHSDLRRSLRHLRKEGFRYVHVLEGVDEIEAAVLERQRLWTNRKDLTGPFDIIGDVHGCYDELTELLTTLGYELGGSEDEPRVIPPERRQAVFLGDLGDRGPATPSVLRLVMSMVSDGTALCVPGNHDVKLLRWLRGKRVKIAHGLQESIDQLEAETDDFRSRVTEFLDGLVSHYVLDGGRLVLAHAGLREEYQGRASGRVRSFALYGETTGESDEFGLPVRYDWAAEYKGRATVVYGHTPVPAPEWLNHTINIDTGCVFGGSLTALRYPEKELVSVAAKKVYHDPIRPLETPRDSGSLTGQQLADDVLDAADVLGKRIVRTRLAGNVTIREENSMAALEAMSRWAVDPRWLIHLPPTMSPPPASSREDVLEHPDEVFASYRAEGVTQVICERKHMGSRAILVVCRTPEVGVSRFGAIEPRAGAIYTRTGRPFFEDGLETLVLERIANAIDSAVLWDELDTDWVCLDAEIMPWSFKAVELLRSQYASVGAAASRALPEAIEAVEAARARGVDVGALPSRLSRRADAAERFVDAYRRYCWPYKSLEDLAIAPFHILASEGSVHDERPHLWHLDVLGRIVDHESALLERTDHREVDLSSEASCAEAVEWWTEITEGGSEGMVVKPRTFLARGTKRLVQPAIKCRGCEYLRIIYGPDYLEPENLRRVKNRNVRRKQGLAMREFALGLEALHRFVAREPLRRTHECVFGVLALESEPVDPRL